MAQVKVKDRDGAEHTLESPNGVPLMETLRDEDMDVEGTCGGICSCGTCHVYVAPEWADRLPAMGEDEEMMLEAIGEVVEVRPNSRLSCQIELTEDLEGLELEVGPVA